MTTAGRAARAAAVEWPPAKSSGAPYNAATSRRYPAMTAATPIRTQANAEQRYEVRAPTCR